LAVGRHSAGEDITETDTLRELFADDGRDEAAETIAGGGLLTEGPGSRTQIRNMALAMIALTAVVIAMLASYSGAFAKPTLHHLGVAVAGSEQFVDTISHQNYLRLVYVCVV
jgi:hypothetical protein